MTVDLSYDELVLLVQLVQQRFIQMQRKDPKDTAPFETALFKRLYDAHMDAMDEMKRTGGHTREADWPAKSV